MYADNHRQTASQRVNDEFLRRMVGGNLNYTSRTDRSEQASVATSLSCPMGCDRASRSDKSDNCPTHVHAPSLAMVYCPRQCWRNVFSPEEGLSKGSIFSELVLPLEAEGRRGNHCSGTEVRTRK